MTDAVINLRSILLILKLVSIAVSQEYKVKLNTAVCNTLWQVLQKPLNHVNCCFDTVPAADHAARGYATAKDHPNTQQSCQLVAAIICLMMPLIRANLRQNIDHITEYCTVLKCLLLPQWGLPADAAKAEFLKSGANLSDLSRCHTYVLANTFCS